MVCTDALSTLSDPIFNPDLLTDLSGLLRLISNMFSHEDFKFVHLLLLTAVTQVRFSSQFLLQNRSPVMITSPHHFLILTCLAFCFFLAVKRHNMLHHAVLNFVYICLPMRSGERELLRRALWQDNLIYPVMCEPEPSFRAPVVNVLFFYIRV